MWREATRYLRCPRCSAVMTVDDGSLHCAAGHRFDVARQGYANLLPRATSLTADTAEMVAARVAFLDAGHYAPIAEALVVQARDTAPAAEGGPGCVVDAGGGPGYYAARVMEAFPQAQGVLLDLSTYAARRAARAHPRVVAAVVDVWGRWPVGDTAATVVLDVFAPRNPREMERVLRPGGVLLVVTPTPDHVRELRVAFDLLGVEGRKRERLAAGLGAGFREIARDSVRHTMTLGHDDLVNLVMMGPNAWHSTRAEIAERASLVALPCPVTLSVTLSAFRRL